MPNPKITQSLLNPTVSTYRNLLKFCYFLTVFVLISCGNDTKSKATLNATENATTETESSEKASSKTILFFGDSITAGYGLDDTNDAFPGIIQTKIDSLGLNYQVVNSGVSGETSAGGKSRIDWILNQDIDIFILELGANDGLRGVAITETKANLQAIIDAVKAKSPNTKIVLAGMQLPPNMGADYTTQFKEVFSDLASKNDLAFIPFILKDVGGVKKLNQNDGIHPTAEGHKILAKTVWEVLSGVIKEEA
ncbi:lysophospholipase L1-like esterase [Aequorivita sublithincola DSM 14238]|uniref:Lysophospholipase L1-like esterase n=1 Tax=Aequorivita sublithincola (strain DSM 14238 / LMG 21431 / ACAM 643 / 9-3) TaxID=746697 RepID=I3YYS2_AEQSU|nr:arylesterase [Aequorivita sublithincola]AFL82140.1 lysophospholipase L1-like esterase [Aequorivita sublithincola DSM 14238]